MKTILSLCDLTGNWSRPYEEAGYEVLRFDLARDDEGAQDVRKLMHLGRPIHGILCAPPCTHLARSGAHLWKSKGEPPLLDALSVVDACLRAVAIYRPEWWALENPIGRLKDYLGPPHWRFDPCDFGDPWTKRTWLWGHFTPPMPLFAPQARKAVAVTLEGRPGGRDATSRLSSRDKVARSATPPGFSQAFFEANR